MQTCNVCWHVNHVFWPELNVCIVWINKLESGENAGCRLILYKENTSVSDMGAPCQISPLTIPPLAMNLWMSRMAECFFRSFFTASFVIWCSDDWIPLKNIHFGIRLLTSGITICRLVWITWRIQGNHRWCTVAPTSSDQCNDQCNLCVDKVSCFLDLDLNELVLNFAAHLDDPKLCHRNSLSDPQTKKHKKFQNFDLLNFKEGTKIWMRLCVVI